MKGRVSGNRAVVAMVLLLIVGSAAPLIPISSASNESPDPTLLDVSAPSEITIGESFTVRIDAENRGGRAGHWSTISVSAPSLDEGDDDAQIDVTDATDHAYSSVFTAGSEVYNKYGDKITTNYALVEVGTNAETYWGANNERSVSIQFTPEETGTFVFYVRLTFTEDTDSSEKVTHPYSSDWTDQQDYYVLRYEVDVREKPNIDASIVDFDQDGGSYHHGDEVDASTTVKNTGNREHTFFVGYSVRGPDGEWYTNGGTTGKTVTLAPGEQRDVQLEWDAQSDAPLGTYDVKTAVWKESNRDNLVTRLDYETRTSAFSLEESIDAQITAFQQSSGSYSPGDNVTGSVTIENTGTVEHTFYVGYSGRGPNGEFYDNDGATEVEVTLAPGESRTVNLSWEVQPDTPAGSYDMITAVWERRENGKLYGRLDKRTREDVISIEGPDASDVASVRIVSINGNERSNGALQVSNGIVETVTVELTDSNGDPVAGLTPELRLPSKEAGFTLVSSDRGRYRFKPNKLLSLPTGYQDFQLSVGDGASTRTLHTPINSQDDILTQPLEGWVTYGHTERVTVNGNEYTALSVSKETPDGEFVEAWLIFDSNGELVRDMETVRKAALAATVSLKFSNEATMEQFLGTEYPNQLRTILAGSKSLEYAITVRDTSASMLGTITAAYATGGASTVTVGGSQVTKQSAKQATKLAAKELSQKVLKEMGTRYAKDKIRTDVLGVYKSSMRAAAHDELEDSIKQSERAGRLLEQHEDGSQWSYTEARGVWRAYNESMVDGILWSQVRVQTMPSGAPKEQLKQIGLNFVEGATGAPVTTLADLIESGKAGDGYVVALRKTGEYRASLHQDYQRFHTITPLVQQQALEELGTGTTTEEASDGTQGSAAIEILDPASGTFQSGDSAKTVVRVTNTGDEPRRFFVGYSTVTETGSGTLYFDNKDSTGHWVTLAAGESTRTTLEWRVQPDAPTGNSYDIIVAVWPRFPAEGVQRYDGQRQDNAFSVVEGANISITDVSLPDTTSAGEPVKATVTLENTGSAGSKLIELKTGETTLVERVVHVPAGETIEVHPVVSFENVGTYSVTAGAHSTSITVESEQSTASTTNPSTATTTRTATSAEETGTTPATTTTAGSDATKTTASDSGDSAGTGAGDWFGIRQYVPDLPDLGDLVEDFLDIEL